MHLPTARQRRLTALLPALLVTLAAGTVRAEDAQPPPPTTAAPAPAPAPAEGAAPAPTSAPADAAKTPAGATPPAEGTAAPAPAPAPAPEAAPAAPAGPKNRSLEYARELLGKKKADDALKELVRAEAAANGDVDQLREIKVLRAEALLTKKRPDKAGAKAIVVELLHEKPDGSAFEASGEAFKAFAEQIRGEQVLILHEPVTEARPDRPLRLRAGLVDPPSRTDKFVLRFRGVGLNTPYHEEPMTLTKGGGYGALIRSPTAYAPLGVKDDFAAEYYITAFDTAGATLDTIGSEKAPITLTFTTKIPDPAAEMLAAAQPAPLELAPPPPETPWYLRWYTLTAAGVVVVGAVTAVAIVASQPEELPSPRLGTLELP